MVTVDLGSLIQKMVMYMDLLLQVTQNPQSRISYRRGRSSKILSREQGRMPDFHNLMTFRRRDLSRCHTLKTRHLFIPMRKPGAKSYQIHSQKMKYPQTQNWTS